MNKIFCILLFFLIGCICYTQNLVPNYSFEDIISCPTNFSEIYKSKNWFQPTTGTSDYYHQCAPSGSDVDIPNNMDGFQYTHSGEAYAGIIFYVKYDESREYIAVKLTDTLIANKQYCVSFYVNLSDSSKFATDAIGLHFSVNAPTNNSIEILPYIPQIENPKDNFITDTANWTLIYGEYSALGGEQYITIGNFYNDSNTNIINVGGPWPYAYYYIDDVSVVLCDTPYCAGGVIQPQIYTAKDTFLLDSAVVQFTDSSRYASHWQWSFGDSETSSGDTVQNPVYTYDSVGVYTVRLVAGYGNCTDTAEKIIVVEKEVSANYELGIRNYDFRIYPNPTNGQFTITNNEHPIMNYEVKILNILGQTVYQQTLNAKQETLNTKLSEGIYFVQVVDNKLVTAIEKLIIIK